MSELAKALCAVMARVRYVPETGKNTFHRYSYASDEDLLTVLQPAMAEVGLAMIPERVDVKTVEHSPDGKGKPQWRTEVLVTYALLHASGECRTVQAPGCGIDGEDKGVYKAMTGALKYALRHTFLVPTGEDAERHREPPPRRDADSAQQHHDQRRPSPPPSTSASGVSGASSAARGAGPEGSSGGGQRWTTVERERFEGLLGQLVEPAVPLEVLSAYREAQGKTTPAYLSSEQRAELLRRLADPSLRVAILEWAGRDEQTAGGAA